MKEILTEDELCEISGHATRDGLRQWLAQNHIAYILAKSGWPRVHRASLEAAMGVKNAETVKSAPVQFNFEALR